MNINIKELKERLQYLADKNGLELRTNDVTWFGFYLQGTCILQLTDNILDGWTKTYHFKNRKLLYDYCMTDSFDSILSTLTDFQAKFKLHFENLKNVLDIELHTEDHGLIREMSWSPASLTVS